MFNFGEPRPRRRPNLTPMIDVVFLLLIFFMLVSRFGADRVVPLMAAGEGDGWSGPPRLVSIAPGGLALNGVPVAPEGLAAALAPLVADPSDPVILRPQEGVSVQETVLVMDLLGAAGFSRLVLVE
ncbi:MAG: biopolymer transporter ExbD [Gemmobacter sp.]